MSFASIFFAFICHLVFFLDNSRRSVDLSEPETQNRYCNDPGSCLELVPRFGCNLSSALQSASNFADTRGSFTHVVISQELSPSIQIFKLTKMPPSYFEVTNRPPGRRPACSITKVNPGGKGVFASVVVCKTDTSSPKFYHSAVQPSMSPEQKLRISRSGSKAQ